MIFCTTISSFMCQERRECIASIPSIHTPLLNSIENTSDKTYNSSTAEFGEGKLKLSVPVTVFGYSEKDLSEPTVILRRFDGIGTLCELQSGNVVWKRKDYKIIDIEEMPHIFQKKIRLTRYNNVTSKTDPLFYNIFFQTPGSTKLNTKQAVTSAINLFRRAFDIVGDKIMSTAFSLVVYFHLSSGEAPDYGVVGAETPIFRFKCQEDGDRLTLELIRKKDIINR
ncbi:hypothetical protein CDIK_2166 [Cucumispora dikerogammari]|nr:hypothetical protein CDIK_2166 [Cucumispora dikerogammari]